MRGVDVVRVELCEREKIGAKVVEELLVGGVGLDDLWISEGLAEEVDGVEDGAASRRAVLLQGDVLALSKLGERNKRLQREGLIGDCTLVSSHLLRKRAALIELVDGLFVDADTPVEEIIV